MSRRVKPLEMYLREAIRQPSVIILVRVNKVLNASGSGGNGEEDMERFEVLQSVLEEFFPACTWVASPQYYLLHTYVRNANSFSNLTKQKI